MRRRKKKTYLDTEEMIMMTVGIILRENISISPNICSHKFTETENSILCSILFSLQISFIGPALTLLTKYGYSLKRKPKRLLM